MANVSEVRYSYNSLGGYITYTDARHWKFLGLLKLRNNNDHPLSLLGFDPCF